MLDVTLSAAGFEPGEGIYPDVHVVHTPSPRGGGVMVAEPQTIISKLALTNSLIEKMPILEIEIRDIAKRRLVTVIEILSPVNKQGSGHERYRKKRIKLILNDINLLEIELLRGGKRLSFLEKNRLPQQPYFVYLSRVTRYPLTDIWPIALAEPLPVVPIPLLHPDPDVTLDLQTAVNACFELVGYQRLLDYTQPPPPPTMSAEDLAWVKSQLETSL
jgi:hypothetical protein